MYVCMYVSMLTMNIFIYVCMYVGVPGRVLVVKREREFTYLDPCKREVTYLHTYINVFMLFTVTLLWQMPS